MQNFQPSEFQIVSTGLGAVIMNVTQARLFSKALSTLLFFYKSKRKMMSHIRVVHKVHVDDFGNVGNKGLCWEEQNKFSKKKLPQRGLNLRP